MFECSCGKKYKYPSGLSNHKEKCASSDVGVAAVAVAATATVATAAAGGSAASVASATNADDIDDITKSPFFTIPLTSFKPTAKFTKEDLEMLENRKQARLKAILKAQQEEKDKKAASDAAAAALAAAKAQAHAITSAASAAAAAASTAGKRAGTVITNNTNNTNNVGNEEHNASFNIKYVRRSEETQQVVRAVTAAAHEYCKGRIIVTSDEPAPGSTSIDGVCTTVNENGTTVYNHPTRTISIIETPPEEVSPEEEHDITLEKMTYLILSLIQNNNKLTKENHMLRSIVARIDPACFD
jgi:hypothetical protein